MRLMEWVRERTGMRVRNNCLISTPPTPENHGAAASFDVVILWTVCSEQREFFINLLRALTVAFDFFEKKFNKP